MERAPLGLTMTHHVFVTREFERSLSGGSADPNLIAPDGTCYALYPFDSGDGLVALEVWKRGQRARRSFLLTSQQAQTLGAAFAADGLGRQRIEFVPEPLN